MDDEVVTGLWQIDPDTRLGLRLEAVRRATERQDWSSVVLEAEELLDDAPRHGEALGMLAGALLELGDARNAVDAYEDHLALVEATAEALSGLAIARFELCDLPGAASAAREAIRLDGSLAEAHYTLGLTHERLGRIQDAVRSFQVARTLEPTAYPLPMDLGPTEIEQALRLAIRTLPPTLVEFWRDVPILLEEEPALDELRSASNPVPPTVAGLYAGDPPEGDLVLDVRPDALRLFKKNLARCGTLDEVAHQLSLVLEQEALDWLGVPLDEIE